jgi:hypothetical protein
MRCVCVQVSFGTFATTRGSWGGLWGSAGLWCKMGLLGASGAQLGTWGSTGRPLGLNWAASGGKWGSWGASGAQLGPLAAPSGSRQLWGGSLGLWRVLAAPGASGGSWRVLTPGGLGESLLGSQTVTVKTLVENRVENGVEII